MSNDQNTFPLDKERVDNIRAFATLNWTDVDEHYIEHVFSVIDSLMFKCEQADQKDKSLALLPAREHLNQVLVGIAVRKGYMTNADKEASKQDND